MRLLGEVKIDWGVYGSLEALFDDESIYLPTCSFGDVAAAGNVRCCEVLCGVVRCCVVL